MLSGSNGSNKAVNVSLTNLKLVVEYDGKNYCGWQKQSRQSKSKTIQQTIEESLQVLFPRENIRLTGAGRTDSGVHAVNQTANFKINRPDFNKNSIRKLMHSLNSILPHDIAVKKISRVPENFHSRFSAKQRIYRYSFSNHKKAILNDKIYRVSPVLNISFAEEFCNIITGINSFKTLCKNRTDEHDFKCIVHYAKLRVKTGGVFEFEICANRFLHSMVRAVTGALINVMTGKLSIKEFKSKFNKGEELKVQFVPAYALFLYKVNY